MLLKLSPTAKQQNYRPDIDGLRAIAVISVVMSHAFPSALRGGFVGVDIFFVISGYLITSIIAGELEKDCFSFKEFYGRRIRRIFPALLIVLIFVAALGSILLLPIEFDQLGQHIAAGAGFVSNFMLWSESGYFDTASETKPLLHLWSLGIEEQFYIVWPLILWGTRKLRLDFGAIAFFLLLFSFLDNLCQTTMVGAFGDPVRLFYSPETRFWELMSGALLSFCPSPFSRSSLFKNLSAAVGLVLIGVSVILSTDLNFPGVQALLPVSGCLLLIASGGQTSINRKCLANPVLVYVGLISYPLYLWHWPLLSFARILAGSTPSLFVRVEMILAALAFASATYHFLEMPIRFGKRKNEKTIILMATMMLLACAGLIIHFNEGFPPSKQQSRTVDQFNQQQLVWDHWRQVDCINRIELTEGDCNIFGNPNHITTAVIGDSIANALSPGLAAIYANADDGLINIDHASCPPVRGLVEKDKWKISECHNAVAKEYKFILENPSVKTVVMGIFAKDVQSYVLPGLADDASIDERFKVFSRLLNQDIADLIQHGKKVIINYDEPYLPFDPRDCINRPFSVDRQSDCRIRAKDLVQREPYITLYNNLLKNRKDVCTFNLSDLLIKNGIVTIFDDRGRLLMRDNHHVGDYGSEQAAILFKQSDCYSE